MKQLFQELKRRNVYKVAATYAVVGFVVIQVADLTFVRLGLPPWTVTFVIVLVTLGLPIAVVLAWAFEMTPEGVRRTREPGSSEREPGAETGTGRLAYRVLFGLGLAVVAVAGGWYLAGNGGKSDARVVESSLAVLPFDNLSGADAAQPFVNGVHGDLITRLSNISGLTVISRTSVLPYRGTGGNIPAIAESLGVGWIVEGGVQQAGDRVQVTAQLVRGEDAVNRWAQTYERRLTTENLFAIQSELTKKIARSLQARLSPEEQSRVEQEPTGDLEAYRLYAQGRNLLDRRTGSAMPRALDYFQRAIERDSAYALAWSGLADGVGLLESYGYPAPERAPGQAEAARRALELDPGLAEAHASYAYWVMSEGQGATALRHYRRAVELKPSYAQARHWLGWLLPPLGRLEEAEEHASLAVELNPGQPGAAMVHAEVLVATGRAETALAEVRRVRRRSPEYSAAPMNEALALLHLGRPEEARRAALAGLPDAEAHEDRARTMLAVASAALADSAEARRWLERMREAGDSPAFLGLVRAALGDTDAAFSTFRSEESWPGWATTGLRYWFPELLAPLRGDARYEALIREVNTSWGLNPDGSLPDSADIASESQFRD